MATGELRKRLNVNAMTLWRDLNSLEEQGLIRRVRGGAELSSGSEDDFEAKSTEQTAAKRRIGAAAVENFAQRGMTLALEGGTTVMALVEHLPLEQISIITNSLPVASRLRQIRPDLRVRMPPGWLNGVSGNLCGPETVRWFRSQKTDLCFIGATGFDAERGPTDPNPLEIEAKRAMLRQSEKVILLIDQQKFGRRSTSQVVHPKHLSAIVTDGLPEKRFQRYLKQFPTELIVA
jgi:DeoR/GlpR family transcriptional regulator of sugar metabolism